MNHDSATSARLDFSGGNQNYWNIDY
jgi:hypothetical protein